MANAEELDAWIGPTDSIPSPQAEALEEAFEVRKREFAALHPDYEATIKSLNGRGVLPHIADFITKSRGGVAVGYHLAKNPQVLSEISALGVHDALAQLHALEVTLVPTAQLSWLEPWWIDTLLEQFERTATLEQKRAAADLSRLYGWQPDTQPH